MICDAFLFAGELDMLECRLTELDGFIDRYIIAEADVTFQGRPKPLSFDENQDRFSRWADRIIYTAVSGLPAHEEELNPWHRENAQRRWLLKAVGENAGEGDLVIFGDVDEIPRKGAIRHLRPGVTLELQNRLFAVDWCHPSYPWYGPVILDAGHIFEHPRGKRGEWPHIQDAGWHFSWLGGPDGIREKVYSFSHEELIPVVEKMLDEGHLYRDGLMWASTNGEGELQLRAVESDDYPAWVRERKCPASWWRPR